MFTNNTFVGNHSLTSNGYSTFSVPNDQNFNNEFSNYELVVEAKAKKKHLAYYYPFSIQFKLNKTLKIEIKKYSLHIGDIIDFITRKTGIKALIVKLTNGNCGCEARRQKFNKWFVLPIIKIWLDNHDYEDEVIIRSRTYRKQLIRQQEEENKRLETLYDNVKRNIIAQAQHQDKQYAESFEQPYPQPNRTATDKPASNGCGCGTKMKKTVNYI